MGDDEALRTDDERPLEHDTRLDHGAAAHGNPIAKAEVIGRQPRKQVPDQSIGPRNQLLERKRLPPGSQPLQEALLVANEVYPHRRRPGHHGRHVGIRPKPCLRSTPIPHAPPLACLQKQRLRSCNSNLYRA